METLGSLLNFPKLVVSGTHIMHKCHCGAQIDVLGRHHVSCKLSAGCIPRHRALNDLIKLALDKTGFPS